MHAMPSRREGVEGGHTVDLAPETARVRHRYRGRLYGKQLKTKNAKRTVELHAMLRATLREIRPAKLHQHSFVFASLRDEPIRPARSASCGTTRSESWDPPIPPRGLYHTKNTFCAHRVVRHRVTRQAGEADG